MSTQENDEEDYMSMTFAETPSSQAAETSLQRRARQRREAEIRSRPKSTAELEAEAAAAREAALATSLLENNKKSKGLAMMRKMGFVPGNALGADVAAGESRTQPIGISVKEDRGGIGVEAERKRRIREEAREKGIDPDVAAKRLKGLDLGEFRERVMREQKVAKCEKQVYAAQKTAERMFDERSGDNEAASVAESDHSDGVEKAKTGKTKKLGGKTDVRGIEKSRPLKSIPVLWRGMVRAREEAERERRKRQDWEQNDRLRLPVYEDDEADEDDRLAMQQSSSIWDYAEEDDPGEDEELESFNALDAEAKSGRLVEYLRSEFRYCFWCKFAYPDEDMEGCPGLTEEDHD